MRRYECAATAQLDPKEKSKHGVRHRRRLQSHRHRPHASAAKMVLLLWWQRPAVAWQRCSLKKLSADRRNFALAITTCAQEPVAGHALRGLPQAQCVGTLPCTGVLQRLFAYVAVQQLSCDTRDFTRWIQENNMFGCRAAYHSNVRLIRIKRFIGARACVCTRDAARDRFWAPDCLPPPSDPATCCDPPRRPCPLEFSCQQDGRGASWTLPRVKRPCTSALNSVLGMAVASLR